MKGNDTFGALIVGVGGQGTLLASRVIGRLALKRGYDVKVSEVHGMSQRGGSVVTYVRYSCEVTSPVKSVNVASPHIEPGEVTSPGITEGVASPLIEPGEADIIIAFELLEAVRWLDYLRPGGMVVVNSQKIDPMPVITGAARYPEGLDEIIKHKCAGAVIIDALKIALECGSVRSVNFVLLGVASAFMGFSRDDWVSSIREVTPQRALDINLAAFEAGLKLGV